MSTSRPIRVRAAASARALCEGRIAWEEFEAEFADVDDPKVQQLVDRIAHEPDPGGFFGVGKTAYRIYRAALDRLIAELEADQS